MRKRVMVFVSVMAMLSVLIISAACGDGGNPQSETSPVAGEFVNDSGYYLNSDAYIVPGLGDAGDRIFGTK